MLKVIDAPWFKIIDGTEAFATPSAKLLRTRRFRSNYPGHAQWKVPTIVQAMRNNSISMASLPLNSGGRSFATQSVKASPSTR